MAPVQGASLRAPATVVKVDLVKDAKPEPQPTVTSVAAPATENGGDAVAALKLAKGRLRRSDQVSVKMQDPVTVVPKMEEEKKEPLTQDELEAAWHDMLNAMHEPLPKLYDQLQDKSVTVDDEESFVITIYNSYTDSEIKAHLIRMLTYLRKRLGRPMLNCHTQIVAPVREVKPYTAKDKYDVMVHENAELDAMRILFPEVEM